MSSQQMNPVVCRNVQYINLYHVVSIHVYWYLLFSSCDFRSFLSGFGKCPMAWGFVSHHFLVSVGDEISPIFGWCETLAHLPTPVFIPKSLRSAPAESGLWTLSWAFRAVRCSGDRGNSSAWETNAETAEKSRQWIYGIYYTYYR